MKDERWKMKVPFCHRFEDLLPSRRVVTSQGYLIFWKNIWKTFLLWNCYFGVEREKRTICFRLNNRFKFGHHSIQRDTLLRDTDQIKKFYNCKINLESFHRTVKSVFDVNSCLKLKKVKLQIHLNNSYGKMEDEIKLDFYLRLIQSIHPHDTYPTMKVPILGIGKEHHFAIQTFWKFLIESVLIYFFSIKMLWIIFVKNFF
jgi:hypothetical protein